MLRVNNLCGFGSGAEYDPYWANVRLLCHFDGTDGSTTITDSTGLNSLTASGNAHIEADQSKFGGTSLALDGSGDYVSCSYSKTRFDWYAEDYTVEMFVYASSWANWNYTDVIAIPNAIGNASTSALNNYWSFGPISTGVIRFYYWTGAKQNISSTATVNTNQWNHIALCKSGTTIYLAVNGTVSSGSIVGTPQSGEELPLVIGQINNTSASGYIDALRITKGTARYTANFTPPSTPFPNQ